MTRHPFLLRAALAAMALAAGSAMAQSADLSTWTRVGDAAATAGSVSLSTAAVESGETPLFGGNALFFTDLEPAMGTAFDGDSFEGSGVFTRFSAAAGTRVSVNWSLATTGFDAGFADRAYAVIDGTAVAIATVAAVTQTGSFAHTFTTGGTHTLGFAVLDVNDVSGVSTLGISGLTVSAVPEPGTWALLLGGLGLVAGRARRRG